MPIVFSLSRAKALFLLSASMGLMASALFSGPVKEFIGFLQVEQVNYEEPLSVLGAAKLKSVKAQELQICGPLEANDLRVLGNLNVLGPVQAEGLSADEATVTGPLSGNQIEFRNLKLVGPFVASRVQVKGVCSVVGPVVLQQSKLQKLEVIADEVTLEDVEITQILFKKPTKPDQPPKLILKGKTTIQQGICFETGDGQIQVEGSQVTIKGTVEGALPFGSNAGSSSAPSTTSSSLKAPPS